MRRTWRAGWLTGIALAALAQPAMPGDNWEFPVEFNGGTRWTTVYVPPGYQPGAPVVLLGPQQ